MPMTKQKLRLRLSLTFGALQTFADGRMLAAQVLYKMENYVTDDTIYAQWPWSMFARYRTKDTEQDNVVLRCIERIQTKGTAEALAGFCTVLTDHLGQHGSGGGTYYPCVYEDATEREMTGKPGPWPTCDDDPKIDAARDDPAFQSFKELVLPGDGGNHA